MKTEISLMSLAEQHQRHNKVGGVNEAFKAPQNLEANEQPIHG